MIYWTILGSRPPFDLEWGALISLALEMHEPPSREQSITREGGSLPKSDHTQMTPKTIASKILDQLDLPESLRGRTVTLVGFDSEDDCRTFYPDRSLSLHEHACAFVKAEVRRRGGETNRWIIRSDYIARSWCVTQPADFADSQNQLMPMLVLS